MRGWVVLDAELGFGIAGLELVGAPGDSEPGMPVLGVWDSEPVDDWDGVSARGVPALGVSDSEPVWALAGKASIAPKAATVRKRQCLRKADRRI